MKFIDGRNQPVEVGDCFKHKTSDKWVTVESFGYVDVIVTAFYHGETKKYVNNRQVINAKHFYMMYERITGQEYMRAAEEIVHEITLTLGL